MKYTANVIQKRIINKDTLILQFSRDEISFQAGQYIVIGLPNDKEAREYSIYSGENDKFIEILVKVVDKGSFSQKLEKLEVGDKVTIDGPFGYFIMKPDEVDKNKHVFIASGTGISPFTSYVKSYPKLNYDLLHGIGLLNEKIEPEIYTNGKLNYCVSREKCEFYNGRITNYLKQNGFDKGSIYHLCGNSAMINDVTNILEDGGINPKNIRTEVFF